MCTPRREKMMAGGRAGGAARRVFCARKQRDRTTWTSGLALAAQAKAKALSANKKKERRKKRHRHNKQIAIAKTHNTLSLTHSLIAHSHTL